MRRIQCVMMRLCIRCNACQAFHLDRRWCQDMWRTSRSECHSARIKTCHSKRRGIDCLRVGLADREQLGQISGVAWYVITEADGRLGRGIETGQRRDRHRAAAGFHQPRHRHLGARRVWIDRVLAVEVIAVVGAGADNRWNIVGPQNLNEGWLVGSELAGRAQAVQLNRNGGVAGLHLKDGRLKHHAHL